MTALQWYEQELQLTGEETTLWDLCKEIRSDLKAFRRAYPTKEQRLKQQADRAWMVQTMALIKTLRRSL